MIIRGDARRLPLKNACVQCCVTSPPYWGLRNYGDDDQLGMESTPDAYVEAMVNVFREVRPVLKDDGTLWLNLGDSYSSGGRSSYDSALVSKSSGLRNATALVGSNRPAMPDGLKPKDLVGIPWRVAFALQADGWYLRSDIIWSKPNPMPESVTDRPTKAHEYLFLLAKAERYYYDAAAIAEESVSSWNSAKSTLAANGVKNIFLNQTGQRRTAGADTFHRDEDRTGRNKRTVWTVNTQPYSGAHFATMPEKLVEPCVLAGSRLGDLVLDPFLGSGTVGEVAENLGRKWVGTDLTYQPLATNRTMERSLLSAFPEAFDHL